MAENILKIQINDLNNYLKKLIDDDTSKNILQIINKQKYSTNNK